MSRVTYRTDLRRREEREQGGYIVYTHPQTEAFCPGSGSRLGEIIRKSTNQGGAARASRYSYPTSVHSGRSASVFDTDETAKPSTAQSSPVLAPCEMAVFTVPDYIRPLSPSEMSALRDRLTQLPPPLSLSPALQAAAFTAPETPKFVSLAVIECHPSTGHADLYSMAPITHDPTQRPRSAANHFSSSTVSSTPNITRPKLEPIMAAELFSSSTAPRR
jgi:hypothetical protein